MRHLLLGLRGVCRDETHHEEHHPGLRHLRALQNASKRHGFSPVSKVFKALGDTKSSRCGGAERQGTMRTTSIKSNLLKGTDPQGVYRTRRRNHRSRKAPDMRLKARSRRTISTKKKVPRFNGRLLKSRTLNVLFPTEKGVQRLGSCTKHK